MFNEINLLVFDAAPQTLDEHVVHLAALSIHADLNAEILQATCSLHGGKLTTLVGVENHRDCSGVGESLVQGLQTKTVFHGVGDSPAQAPDANTSPLPPTGRRDRQVWALR